jgi:hypothetical protein
LTLVPAGAATRVNFPVSLACNWANKRGRDTKVGRRAGACNFVCNKGKAIANVSIDKPHMGDI